MKSSKWDIYKSSKEFGFTLNLSHRKHLVLSIKRLKK